MGTRNFEEQIQPVVPRSGDIIAGDGRACAVLRAGATATAAGDNTLITATAGFSIRLLGAVAVAKTAVDAKFKSGASTDISGTFGFAAGGGMTLPFAADGWCETAVGAPLVLNLSAAAQVGAQLIYALVPQ